MECLIRTLAHNQWTEAPHREMSPQIAAKNKWRRMEMIVELKTFQAKYKKAMMKLNR
jgi:hypothetical protein